MSSCIKKLQNLNSLADLMSSKDGKEAEFRQSRLLLWARIPNEGKNTTHQLPLRGEKVNLCHVVLFLGKLPTALSQFFSDVSCST